MMRYLILFLISLCALDLGAISQQSGFSLSPQLPSEVLEESSVPKKRAPVFVYGAVSGVPGVGFSIRTPEGPIRHGFDCKLVVDVFRDLSYFDLPSVFPSLGYEIFFCFDEGSSSLSSFYFSSGIGATLWVIPYVPLRLGFQSDKLFIDIGAKVLGIGIIAGRELMVMPIPELRAGLNFRF